jgi:hypothetical protein
VFVLPHTQARCFVAVSKHLLHLDKSCALTVDFFTVIIHKHDKTQDRLAIDCLERAVDTDPYNLEALLALGQYNFVKRHEALPDAYSCFFVTTAVHSMC